jgi:hypothetical protein
MLLNISSLCTTHKSSDSTRFTEQIIPISCILRYNGSLVNWTVVGLTSAKFKPLVFSMSGFTLSNWNPLILYSLGTDHSQKTYFLLLRACLLGFPHDRYPASPLARWLLPSNGLDANHIEDTAPVFLTACLFERVYLTTGFSGSIVQCFQQTRHSICMYSKYLSKLFARIMNV